MLRTINRLLKILVLFSVGFDAGATTGLTGGIQAVLIVSFMFLLWIVLGILLGFIWYRKIRRIWVWILSPLIVIVVPVVLALSFMLIGRLATKGNLSSAGWGILGGLTCLIVSLLLCYKGYVIIEKKWIKNIIPLILMPVILIGFLIFINGILNIY